MDLLELLKTIGAAAGNIVTISGCLALCIRPIREKLARFIRRASRTDASEKRIADMFAMLEQHIEADQAKIVSSELLKKASTELLYDSSINLPRLYRRSGHPSLRPAKACEFVCRLCRPGRKRAWRNHVS